MIIIIIIIMIIIFIVIIISWYTRKTTYILHVWNIFLHWVKDGPIEGEMAW